MLIATDEDKKVENARAYIAQPIVLDDCSGNRHEMRWFFSRALSMD